MVNVYHQTFLLATINYQQSTIKVLIGNNQHGDKYFGICKTEFKTRSGNHKNSSKNSQKEKETELSKYIWDLKDKNITYHSIKWSIVIQTSGYNSVTNSCNLYVIQFFILSVINLYLEK